MVPWLSAAGRGTGGQRFCIERRAAPQAAPRRHAFSQKLVSRLGKTARAKRGLRKVSCRLGETTLGPNRVSKYGGGGPDLRAAPTHQGPEPGNFNLISGRKGPELYFEPAG